MLQDVIADSASRNQVMLDLLNEPDSQFWKWENAGPAYLQAMDALHQVGLSDQVLQKAESSLHASALWCWLLTLCGSCLPAHQQQAHESSLSQHMLAPRADMQHCKLQIGKTDVMTDHQ